MITHASRSEVVSAAQGVCGGGALDLVGARADACSSWLQPA